LLALPEVVAPVAAAAQAAGESRHPIVALLLNVDIWTGAPCGAGVAGQGTRTVAGSAELSCLDITHAKGATLNAGNVQLSDLHPAAAGGCATQQHRASCSEGLGTGGKDSREDVMSCGAEEVHVSCGLHMACYSTPPPLLTALLDGPHVPADVTDGCGTAGRAYQEAAEQMQHQQIAELKAAACRRLQATTS
jgi:hypothetical protein